MLNSLVFAHLRGHCHPPAQTCPQRTTYNNGLCGALALSSQTHTKSSCLKVRVMGCGYHRPGRLRLPKEAQRGPPYAPPKGSLWLPALLPTWGYDGL